MQNTVEGQQLCEDVVGTLTEFSMYYRELLDKVVSIDKEDEELPWWLRNKYKDKGTRNTEMTTFATHAK